jgi:hypothetical protein
VQLGLARVEDKTKYDDRRYYPTDEGRTICAKMLWDDNIRKLYIP